MPFTNFWSQTTLNYLFNKAGYVQPTVYVGLSSTLPGHDGTNITEPSTGSYARVATVGATWTTATLANPSVLSNAATVTFPTATGNWVLSANLGYVILYDAATNGNVLAWGTLDVAKPVLSGDTASFAIGAISFTAA